MMGDDAEVRSEARVFGRYLVGRLPPDELIERYAEANRVLFTEPADAADVAVVRFARRHPWSVPFLDAAAGLRRPGGLLRSKVLVMAAILETSPAFADEFLPHTVPSAALVLCVGVYGLLAVMQAAVGILLYAATARSRA
jgi:hypothetical protein